MSQYASSGVNIEAGAAAISLMRGAVESTYNDRVLSNAGSFGGMFAAAGLGRDPVLVASTDGVGTKVIIANWARRYRNLGHDLVNHCVNDILVQGARPLFFLDYVATGHLEPEVVAEIVTGLAEACRAVGCALLGGETAEMPGVYAEGQLDLAGTIVGVAERDSLLPRNGLASGDVILGFPSSGPHTNGYSLLRKIFYGIPLDTIFPELGEPLVDALLRPHRCYFEQLWSRMAHIKALAHLTGGGLWDNLPRVLPKSLLAAIDQASWPVPPLFRLIQQRGQIEEREMFRVFNMGIGMLAIVAPSVVDKFPDAIRLGHLEIGHGVEMR